MTRRMLLEAVQLTADEVVRLGVVADPLPAEVLQEHVQQTAHHIAALSPMAACLNKQTLRALAQGQWPKAPYAYADSAEHREGIAAFLVHRAACF
jgi:enoyl-CoA hydratase